MNKRNRITIIISCTVVAIATLSYHLVANGSSASAASEEAFASAAQAAAEGNYAEAIAGFTGLIEDGQHSAAIYYNLAVAHHRAGDLGRAILEYERAASLEPGGSDIRANLERARKESGTVEAPAPRQERFAESANANRWTAVAASGLFALALLAVGRVTRILDLPKAGMRIAVTVGLAMVAIPAAALLVQYQAGAGRAVVTGEGISLQVSPFELAKPIADLAPGRSLRILPERHGDYSLAQLDTGEKGWVRSSELEFANITAK